MDRVRSLITEEAADWFVANREGLDVKERCEFAEWLKASPVHVEEYLAVSVITRDLRLVYDGSQGSVGDLLERSRLEDASAVRRLWPSFGALSMGGNSHRRLMTAGMIAGVAVLSALLAAWWPSRPMASNAGANDPALRFETHQDEQQVYRLTDTTVLYLNSDSRVTIHYNSHGRFVVLNAGEAFFSVAHEPSRPFIVTTGRAEVHATGAKFDVRLDQNSTVVTVVQGRVAVGPDAEGPNAAQLALSFVEAGANEQLRVAEKEWPPSSTAVDAERLTAWLPRSISFNRIDARFADGTAQSLIGQSQ